MFVTRHQIGIMAVCVLLLAVLIVFVHFLREKVEAQEAQELIDNSGIPAWERKKETDEVLRISMISDLRITLEDNYTFASDIEDRYFARPEYTQPFILFRERASAFVPDYVISMGDMVVGKDQTTEESSSSLRYVKAQYDKIIAEPLWVMGNRDLRSLSRTQFQEITSVASAPYAVDRGDYRIIILDSNFTGEGVPFGKDEEGKEYERGFIDQAQLTWLEEQLQTSRHVYVFVHHGMFDQSVTRKDGGERFKSVKNAEQVRALFAEYNVSAVFFANLRTHYYEEDEGVSYYSLKDLRARGDFPGAFYEMIAQGEENDVSMYYIDQGSDESDLSDDVLVSEPFLESARTIDEDE